MSNYNYKEKLLQLKRNQFLLYIGIFTLFTVFIWIAATLLRSQTSSGITRELREAATPLNPNINTELFTQLQQKRVFSSQELNNFPIYMINRGLDGRTPTIVPIGTTTEQVRVPLPIVVEEESIDEENEENEVNNEENNEQIIPNNNLENLIQEDDNSEIEIGTNQDTL